MSHDENKVKLETHSETPNLLINAALNEELLLDRVHLKPDDFKEESQENEENIFDHDKDSDFDFKKELNNEEYSDCSENRYKENTVTGEKQEPHFCSIFLKNYKVLSMKEEPIEDFKSIFKFSNFKFEKQRYHQAILEDIIKQSNRVDLKEMQELYILQLQKAANIEIYICSMCEYQTMNLNNLDCHLLSIHNGKLESESFKCNKCSYRSNFRNFMRRHVIKHKKILRKQKTQFKVYSPQAAEDNHFYSDSNDDNEDAPLQPKPKKKSANQEKYPCASCSYKGRTPEGLRKHMQQHKDKTICDLCSFQSRDKKVLKAHKHSHFVDKYYRCYKCEYKNTNKTTLGRHLLNEHKISNEASKRSKICEICSFACSNSNALNIHYLSHKTVDDLKEEEIFKCPEPGCNHQTKQKNHLKVHMVIHKAPKFVCETCGLASRRKQTYEDHISTHKKGSEIEWLHCPTCPYKARVRAHLRAHIKKGLHGEPSKRHFRLKYREGDDAIPKRIRKPKRVKENESTENPTTETGEAKKPKKKRKPKSKVDMVVNDTAALVNFGEFASAFFRSEVI